MGAKFITASRQKFLLIDMSSLLNAERNDMGTGLDSGGANNLGTTREIRPTIGSVASDCR
jgi:hypothetical protein